MKEYVITPSELKELMEKNEDVQLVDVRTTEKHQAYNIGGVLIPLEEMPARLNELDRDKLIVTYCTMGGRSMNALMYLMSVGFTRVKSLDGGMTRWKEESYSMLKAWIASRKDWGQTPPWCLTPVLFAKQSITLASIYRNPKTLMSPTISVHPSPTQSR